MLADPERQPGFPDLRPVIHQGMVLVIHRGTRRLRHRIRSGYLIEGADAAALARAIGVDADVFRRTIADYNHSAETGIDEAFGRGGTDLA